MLSKDPMKQTDKKPSILSNIFSGGRQIVHADGMKRQEEERIVKLMEALREPKDNRPYDVNAFVQFGMAKCEETLGATDFQKVKRFFGIGYKTPQKNSGKPGEIENLLAKLRTIENAMYYLHGFKDVIEACAEKLIYAPEGMDMITKAKLVIMYYRVFFNHEQFVEDFVYAMDPFKKTKSIVYSEAQALVNNPKVITPEEVYVLYYNKIAHVPAIYYDAILFEIASAEKREQAEILSFAELEFDKENDTFHSVNKCMVAPTFAKIRLLKRKVSEPRPFIAVEVFANKEMIEERMDATALYNVYKVLNLTNWKENGEPIKKTHRTLSGSIFVDKEQEYYAPMQNLYVADDTEAERWAFLFTYLCKREQVLKTEVDGNGQPLSEPIYYNMGALLGALNFAYNNEFIGGWSSIYQDFAAANALLAMKDGKAEEIFLEYNRGKIDDEKVYELLELTFLYAQEHIQQHPEIEAIMEQIAAAEEAIQQQEKAESADATQVTSEEPEEVAKTVQEDQEEPVIEEAEEVTVFTFKADDGSDFIVKLPHKEYESSMDFSITAYVPENLDDLPEVNGYSARMNYMMIESLIRHAMASEYITYPDEVAIDVIMNVLIPAYQPVIMEYRGGSIGGWGLEHQCGIPEEIAEGFFNLKAFDVKKAEEKLMELKNNRHAGRSKAAYYENSGLIRTYCYVIENSIPCGAKMKAPKRNSGLKPKILLGLIA